MTLLSRKRIRITTRDCLTALVAVVVFFITFRNKFIQDHLFFDYTKAQDAAAIMLCAFYLPFLVVRKKDRFYLLMFLAFYGWILLMTLLHRGSLKTAVRSYCGCMLIFFYLEYHSRSTRSIAVILNTWKWVLFALVMIDLLTEILYPNGLYESVFDSFNWFLGYKTNRVLYSAPMCLLFFYDSLKRRGRTDLLCWIAIVISVYDAYLSKATAGCVALLFPGVMVILMSRNLLHKFVDKVGNIRNFYLIYFAVFVLLVVLESTNYLERIALLFNKSATFSGRTIIWANCIRKIKETKLLGAGYIDQETFSIITTVDRGTNAHNQILSLLVAGGIVSCAIYFIMLYRASGTDMRKWVFEHGVTLMFVYGMLILGVSNGTSTFSEFGFFMIWLLKYTKKPRKRTGRLQLP